MKAAISEVIDTSNRCMKMVGAFVKMKLRLLNDTNEVQLLVITRACSRLDLHTRMEAVLPGITLKLLSSSKNPPRLGTLMPFP